MLVERWRDIIEDLEQSWVLFRNGTGIILRQPEGDLAVRAIELMREWGPVQVGGRPDAGYSWVAASMDV